jgi:hypothetical protein
VTTTQHGTSGVVILLGILLTGCDDRATYASLSYLVSICRGHVNHMMGVGKAWNKLPAQREPGEYAISQPLYHGYLSASDSKEVGRRGSPIYTSTLWVLGVCRCMCICVYVCLYVCEPLSLLLAVLLLL